MTKKTQTTDESQLDPKAKQETVSDQEAELPENITSETPSLEVETKTGESNESSQITDTETQETPVEEVTGEIEPETQPEEVVAEEEPAEKDDQPMDDVKVNDPPVEETTVTPEETAQETLKEELPAVSETQAPEVAPEEVPAAAEVQEAAADAVKTDEEAEEEAEKKEKVKSTRTRKTKVEVDAHEDSDDSEDETSKDDDLIKQIVDIDDSAEDHDDEEEEEEDEHEEPVEKYDDFSREELLEKLEAVVSEDNVQKIKTRVALIKVAFLRLSREDQHAKLNEFVKGGGNKEEYQPETDPLMEKFNEIFDIYKRNKAKFNEEQEVLKLRNLDSKKQILEELKDLISSEESLKKTYDRFKELQTQWKEIGLVPSTEINNLWQNYHFLVEKFFDKVKISKELRDLDLKKNMEMKVELCEKAEELLLEPSILKSFKQLQKYHEEWREIGPVPADKRDEIWERFKTATDKINERRRDHYNSLAGQREDNLKAKNELCDQAEQLVSQEAETIKEWQENTRKINDLFSTWKTFGPAPKKENEEVWERFKTYLNTFFSNKKEYFSKLKHEQLNNFNLKLDICKQAEALQDSTDWKSTTHELIDLQKEWKSIGPVPRKHSDKIWKRFRAACDEFFQRKSEHFGNMQKNEKENLEKKKDLIRRVKEHAFGSNKNENLQVLKDFQREWMEIGHVPIKEKDKIQKAFREAINLQLDTLNIQSSEIRFSEHRPRYDHQGRGYDRGGDVSPGRKEMNFLAGKINKLKEDIQLWENNIGFLANSKRADVVKKEFEEKIEKAKEELADHITKLRELQESDD